MLISSWRNCPAGASSLIFCTIITGRWTRRNQEPRDGALRAACTAFVVRGRPIQRVEIDLVAPIDEAINAGAPT